MSREVSGAEDAWEFGIFAPDGKLLYTTDDGARAWRTVETDNVKGGGCSLRRRQVKASPWVLVTERPDAYGEQIDG